MNSEKKQIKQAIFNKPLDYSTLFLAVVVLCWLNYAYTIPIDSGDGLAHFFIVQNAWNNPIELLNHWGKPLFTLLASPFAYFGFKAYVGFNILVFALTSWFGIKIATRLYASTFVKLVFPFALLSVPDYTTNVLGGLTEPLFGLLLMIVGYFLIQKKWLWVALITSLLPFSRSEGQFVVIVIGIIFIVHKQWKYLPLLITAWIIYAFAGLLVFNDFLWYFTQSPYQGKAEFYGSGSWFHYLHSWKLHFGWLGIAILGLFFFLTPLKKHIIKLNSPTFLFCVFALVVYFGILFTHAYLWATGQNGALGLSRLATHGLPLFFFACLVGIDSIIRGSKMRVVQFGIGSLLLFISCKSMQQIEHPLTAGEFETELINSAKYLNEIKDQTHKIYYYHPLIALNVKANLKDSSGVFQQKNFLNIDYEISKLKGGEVIVRDAHFGPMEMGLTEENMGSLVRVRSFHAFTSAQSHLGEKYRVDVYQFQPGKTSDPDSTVLSKNNITFSLLIDDLYHLIEEVQSNTIKQNAELLLDIDIKTDEEPSKPLYLVLQKKDYSGSQTYQINKETNIQIPISSNHVAEMLLFVYNPNQVSMPSVSIETKTSLIELPDFHVTKDQ